MLDMRIKQGDTLRFTAAIQDDDCVPVDLANVQLASQVRTSTDELVATLPITITDQTGVVTVEVIDTSQWPIGLLRVDLKVTVAGRVIHSETWGIRVNKAVTS